MSGVRSLKKMTGQDPHFQMVGKGNRFEAEHNKKFRQACEKAGVQPTKRQYSKYRRGMGAAAKA